MPVLFYLLFGISVNIIQVGCCLCKTKFLIFHQHDNFWFRLLAGKQAGEVFSQSDLLQNPIVGLMLGILVNISKIMIRNIFHQQFI